MLPSNGDDLHLLASVFVEGSLCQGQLPARQSERQELLLTIAEIGYRLYGHTKCSMCRAPVRAAMRSVGIDGQGRTFTYRCLCRRCLEGEKAYCRRLTSYVAGVIFDEYVNPRPLVARSMPLYLRAAA